MELTGMNIVGSALIGGSKSVFHAINPATGSEIEPGFHEASSKEIESAVQKAEVAFREYRSKSGKEKADFLDSIPDEIIYLGEDLLRRCEEETGLPKTRLTNERGRKIGRASC